MNKLPHMMRLKLLVTIVDRGKGHQAVDLYRAERLHFEYLCMGLGTANSKILDYFGLSETEKDVVLTMVPKPRIGRLIRMATERFHLTSPGHGILFTIALSGVSGMVPQVLCRVGEPEAALEEEEERHMDEIRYDLILVVVNHGSMNTVMDAAREAGARGGTVLHARRVGYEDGENLFGFTLQPEKEIIAILTPRSQRQEIMVAVNQVAGLSTEASGILFSLPVDDMIGLQRAFEPGQEE